MAAVVAEYTGPQSGHSFRGGDNTQKIHRVYVQITASGNYAGAPGDTLDLTALGDLLKSGYTPIWGEFGSVNSSGHSGYIYEYIPNSSPTLANGFFQVLRCGGANSPLADLGAGAYPAGVTGDTIVGFLDFVRL